jgi:hypothetical protein
MILEVVILDLRSGLSDYPARQEIDRYVIVESRPHQNVYFIVSCGRTFSSKRARYQQLMSGSRFQSSCTEIAH